MLGNVASRCLVCLCVLLSGCSSRDVKPATELYVPDYDYYHNASSLFQFVKTFAASHTGFTRLDDTFKSRLTSPVLVLRMTNFSSLEKKKIKVLFSYGEHAREFFPVESMIHLLMKLLENEHDKMKFASFVLNSFDIYIVPLVNPDGRQYVEKTQNYCWRGTATGVDLNRNFDWSFGGAGSSNDSADEEYRGLYAFSEPETQLLRNLVSSHSFDAFVSFHSGIRQIYVPFSDSLSKAAKKRHYNEEEELRLAEVIASVVPSNRQFTYGVGYEVNDYPADGTSFDYMAGRKNIPFSLAIELWGSGDNVKGSCFDIFNPRSADLQHELNAVFPIYEAFFRFLFDWKVRQHSLKDPFPHMSEHMYKDSDLDISTFQIAYFAIVVFLVILIARKLLFSLRQGTRIIRLKSLGDSLSII
eukprot:m.10928 g.10928  ORF g.10928 m.10928 type:complete len:414 (+) comp22807_c0_seq2:49-1290(+)